MLTSSTAPQRRRTVFCLIFLRFFNQRFGDVVFKECGQDVAERGHFHYSIIKHQVTHIEIPLEDVANGFLHECQKILENFFGHGLQHGQTVTTQRKSTSSTLEPWVQDDIVCHNIWCAMDQTTMTDDGRRNILCVLSLEYDGRCLTQVDTFMRRKWQSSVLWQWGWYCFWYRIGNFSIKYEPSLLKNEKQRKENHYM